MKKVNRGRFAIIMEILTGAYENNCEIMLCMKSGECTPHSKILFLKEEEQSIFLKANNSNNTIWAFIEDIEFIIIEQ